MHTSASAHSQLHIVRSFAPSCCLRDVRRSIKSVLNASTSPFSVCRKSVISFTQHEHGIRIAADPIAGLFQAFAASPSSSSSWYLPPLPPLPRGGRPEAHTQAPWSTQKHVSWVTGREQEWHQGVAID